MASLQETIAEHLKDAMKKKEEVRLGTLRMLKSEIQYELTKTGASEITDDQVLALIRRAIKKRQEAREQFEKGGRAEMAEKETQELKVLEAYLPAGVPDDVLKKKIEEIIAEVKPAGPQDFGKVMGKVMAAFKGQNVDGNTVNKLVRELVK